jgi:hypothetical protein
LRLDEEQISSFLLLIGWIYDDHLQVLLKHLNNLFSAGQIILD